MDAKVIKLDSTIQLPPEIKTQEEAENYVKNLFTKVLKGDQNESTDKDTEQDQTDSK